LEILAAIQKKLPWVNRVGTYANTKSIKRKSVTELEELRKSGLTIAYMGLESGDDVTLKQMHKGADAELMITMGQKIRSAGIHLSVTVLLGIATQERSHIHAQETGRVLSAIDPEYVGALSLMLTTGTKLYDQWCEGTWHQPEPEELLAELGQMIASTELSNGYFHANHASNYLPIKAKLPQDKTTTLARIEEALQGKISLKPEYMRAL
jgi:radical SAM superfamily enzyme YgiQ (UPF0313 family)